MDAADELYARLIAPIEGKMIAAVARLVHDPDEAADVFQDVLAVVWKHLERIDRHPNPHGYIMRICVTRSYDALRRLTRRRRRETPLENPELLEAPKAPSLDPDEEKRDAVRQAIAHLPPKQAQAVLLRAMDEESYGAIGRALGCSEATARSHVSKGTARLRDLLGKPLSS